MKGGTEPTTIIAGLVIGILVMVIIFAILSGAISISGEGLSFKW